MAPSTTAPTPGNMTVPPLFGWQEILAVLALVIAAAVAFLLIAAVCAVFTGRSEWQTFLAGRSRGSDWIPADTDVSDQASRTAEWTRAATADTSPAASTRRSTPTPA